MNSALDTAAWAFCDRILVDVSRSFAVIIPLCPPPINRCLCVGYLLCRLADTVEDDERLSPCERDVLYDALLACVYSPGDPARCEAFVAAWPQAPEGGYGELVLGTRHVLQALQSLPAPYRAPLITCVNDMIAGMRSMRPVATKAGLQFYCRDLSDLDRYCHYVAGTVGIMSTALFEEYLAEQRLPDEPPFLPTDAWREQGRRMGLGLQMTNIIKDACTDAGRGVSFIPHAYVANDGDGPRVTPSGRAELIHHTLTHLDEAICYTTALPGSAHGIRTFLLGSILPAVATLEIAAAGRDELPKIDRATLAALLAFIEQDAGDNAAIRHFYDELRQRCVQ